MSDFSKEEAERLTFLNSSFNKYIDDLKVYEKKFEEGIQLCDQVRKFLERQKEFIIASTHYGEAMEKNDYFNGNPYIINIVMLIKNHLPPFKSFLKTTEKALMSDATQQKIQIDTIFRTKFSVRFSFTTEITVEIFPGDIKMTPEQVFENSGKNKTLKKFYNSSLLQPCHKILNEQDKFTQGVAKLTRFWLKTIDFANSKVTNIGIYSDLFAIDSVSAASRKVGKMKRDRCKSDLIYIGFLGVIKRCESFDKQKLKLVRVEDKDKSQIFQRIENHVIEIIKWNARIMLGRLDDLRRTNEANYRINFERLFETSPLKCPYIITHLNPQSTKM